MNPLKGLADSAFYAFTTPLKDLVVDTATTYIYNTVYNTAASSVYGTSKWAFYSSIELATFFGDKVAHLPEYLINNAAEFVTGSSPNFTLYKDTIRPMLEQNNPLPSLNAIATRILAPEAYQFAQEHADSGVSTFQASDLLGGSLLLALSSKKTIENAVKACTKIGYLVTFKRSIVTLYKRPETSQGDQCTVSIDDEEYLSSGTLLVGASIDTFFAAGWFMLGKLTREGMMTALVEAGNEEPVAANIINAILIATVACKIMPAAWNTAITYWADLQQNSSTIPIGGQKYKKADLEDPMEIPFNANWNSETRTWGGTT